MQIEARTSLTRWRAAPARRVRVLVAALIALMVSSTGEPASATAWLLVNGRVVTLDEGSRIAGALAIRDGQIVAAGTAAEARALAGPAARVIDLGGRTVIPGLIDSHIHAIRAGVRHATEVSWIGAATLVEALGRLSAAATQTRPDEWIVVGGGWTPGQLAERRRPTPAEIEAAAPGRRVYIQLFYRAVLLSREAGKALGLDNEAGLPVGATPDRDGEGRPTGWINGTTAAITGLYDRLPSPTLGQSIEGTRRFLAELNRLGLTGVIDPGGHNLAPEEYEAVVRLAQTDELTVRIAYFLSAPRPDSERADLAALTRLLPMGGGTGMLRFNGIGERVTWGLYNNDTPSEAQKATFLDVARWAARRGLTLTAHWNNDRSVHHLLDIMEQVSRETPLAPLRWSIAHLHDASEASLLRMRAMGVGWLVQNGLYFAAPAFLAQRGTAINRSPPIATAARLGLAVGGGTDAHRVMSHNPFVSMRWMTDGRTVEGITTRTRTELVSREQALRLYTLGSAWFAFDEHRRGSLVPGRLADLAVLDRDLLSVPPEEMAGTRALLTMVGGRVVHAEGPFAELR